MDVSLIINGVLIVLVGYLVWKTTQKTQNVSSESNSQEIISQILLGLNQHQVTFLNQINDNLSQTNQRQTQQLSENLQNLERRFGQVQNQLTVSLGEELGKIQMLQSQTLHETKQKFDAQGQEQKLQFEKLKTDNQIALQSMQNAVQERLSQAIQNLLELNKSELKSIQDLNRQSLDSISKLNQDKLSQIQGEIERKLNENLQQNLKSFEDVTKNLGHLQSTAQKMIDSTSSIDKLNNIFERTSSKSFGNFGEKYLESLLSEYINDKNWAKQVKVPHSSDVIDFVVTIGDQKIGIDSKFPVTRYQDYLEAGPDDKKAMLKAFLNAILQMAADIHAKYSKDGFVNSLLMYLPSDGMYCDVVNIPQAMEQLQKYKVTLTSPTTILPLIALIHEYEFKVDVQERAGDIISGLKIVKKNVTSFREEFRKLGEKIRLAQQNYDTADKSLLTVQNTVLKLETSQAAEELENEVMTTESLL